MSEETRSGRRRFRKWRRRRAKRRVLALVLGLVGILIVSAAVSWIVEERTAQESLNRAMAFRQHGEFAASIIELKSALQTDPQNAQLRISLGKTYLQVNDLASAEKEFRRAQSAGAPPGDVLPLLSQTWLLQGQYQLVLDEVPLDGLTGERRADALVTRSRALAGESRADPAREALDQALEISPQHVGAWLEIARSAIGRDRVEEAGRALHRLRDIAPENLEVVALQGDLYLKSGRYADAVAQYRIVTNRLPGHIPTNVALAQALFEVGRADESVAILDDALRQERGNFAANRLRAAIASEAGDHRAALDHAQRALDTDGSDLRALVSAGSAAFELGQMELAQHMLEKVTALDPENSAAQQVLSAIREQRALRAWDQTLAQLIDDSASASVVAGADDPTAREQQIMNSGLAYLELQRRSDDAVKADAGDEEPAGIMEIFETDQADQAVRLLEFVVTEDNDADDARYLLAEAYLRRGEPEEAFRLVEPDLERQTRNRQVMGVAATAGLITNRPAPARLALKALVDLDPRAVEVHYLLALAYGKLGNREAYLGSLEQALAIDREYAPALAERARAALLNQRLDRAKRTAEYLRLRWPGRPEYFDVVAGVAMVRGQEGDAADLYRRAFDIQPTTVRALRLAYAQQRAGQAAASRIVLANWINDRPDDIEVALVLANKYLSAGELVEASEVYAHVLRHRPDHIVAINNLAWVSLQLGESQIALSLAKRGMELSPDNTRLMDTMAEIHLREGNHEKALPLLRRLVRGGTAEPALQLKLARTLAQTGNRGEARELLLRTLADNRDFPERREAEQLSTQLQR